MTCEIRIKKKNRQQRSSRNKRIRNTPIKRTQLFPPSSSCTLKLIPQTYNYSGSAMRNLITIPSTHLTLPPPALDTHSSYAYPSCSSYSSSSTSFSSLPLTHPFYFLSILIPLIFYSTLLLLHLPFLPPPLAPATAPLCTHSSASGRLCIGPST